MKALGLRDHFMMLSLLLLELQEMQRAASLDTRITRDKPFIYESSQPIISWNPVAEIT